MKALSEFLENCRRYFRQILTLKICVRSWRNSSDILSGTLYNFLNYNLIPLVEATKKKILKNALQNSQRNCTFPFWQSFGEALGKIEIKIWRVSNIWNYSEFFKKATPERLWWNPLRIFYRFPEYLQCRIHRRFFNGMCENMFESLPRNCDFLEALLVHTESLIG